MPNRPSPAAPKPDNIVMRKDEEAQVMDFGLARDMGSEERLSVTGEVMWTLAYTAPEQARGDVEGIDARTDVYAHGGVLYELLTGRPPHAGRTPAVIIPLIATRGSWTAGTSDLGHSTFVIEH